QYPAIRRHDVAIAMLVAAVAPGGTLLFVHHDLDPPGEGTQGSAAAHGGHAGHSGHSGHGEPGAHAADAGREFDPADYVMPDDVAAVLDEGWVVEVHE